MNDSPLPPKSRRSLRRAAYIGSLLLSYLAVAACSSVEIPSAERESVGESQAQLQLSGSATASSVNAGNVAANAADGNTGTRWESVQGVDPQWLSIDLGSQKTFDRVYLSWETAYGKAYTIQQSNDNVNWTTIYTQANGDGGIDDITGLSGNARYVRMYGTQRGTAYGYSLYEMQVHQTAATCLSNDLMTSTTLTMTASSVNGANTAAFANDNVMGSRWESLAADPQSLQVDLGTKQKINRVYIAWETASAAAYTVQVSDDATTWTTLISKAGMPAGANRVDDLTGLNGAGRYVRINGTARTTGYGYSIWELSVYGDPNPNCGGGACTPSCSGKTCGSDGCGGVCGVCALGQNCGAAQACVAGTAGYYNTGKTLDTSVDFGANVKVYSPATAAATIQSDLNSAFTTQESNQFGAQRNLFLFTPGTYGPDVNIGFYTHVAGVGDMPDAVNLDGFVHVDALWMKDANGNPTYNATQNFWRSVENFHSRYLGQNMRWAVSQAAPMRRMHIDKGVELHHNNGWCSGGFIADTKFEDWILSSSQQQFYTRNSSIFNWGGSNWNMVFQGDTGTVPAQSFPTPPMTTVATTPVMREKPFLYVDRDGKWNVFVPAVRTNSSGTSWSSGTQAGSSLPMSSFYIAKSATDTATTMNNALAAGKHLFITPGVYHLNAPLAVNNANTVVLGMGMATLIPDGGVKAMTVADVDGVKIAGILFDAGTASSPVMLEVGPTGASASHSANPTSLHDLVFRVGGTTAVGKAVVSMQVNSNDVIGDHFWVWRADHAQNAADTGWTVNTAQNGVVVNGNNVTFYGLFVEHFQQYQVLWNGNNGKTFFYQSELPYDAPSQASWMNGTSNGWASYKVKDTVTTHEGWGMGVYAVFTVNPGMQSDRAIEAPDAQASVKFHDMVTLSLTANGKLNNVVNTTGGTANPLDFSTYPRLVSWH